MKKVFDTEFKKKTVIVSYIRNNVAEVAAELGIDSSLLYSWRREYENLELIYFFQQNRTGIKELEYENVRLHKLIKEAKRERKILKNQLTI